tara:strand:+ start:178 stop:696 length:519 start_codon:yes stop_codon:yes gene_type:complete
MKSRIAVIDNFLSSRDFINLTHVVSCYSFPWNLNVIVSNECEYKKDNFMFNHIFFRDNPFEASEYFPLLLPITSQLKVSQLYRVKSNFYSRTEQVLKHEWHTDREGDHLAAIFHINSNDGKTIIKDNEEIEVDSVQNRIVIFDGTLLHRSTTCTDGARVNLNFNFQSELDFF